jgi:hypothetical protein
MHPRGAVNKQVLIPACYTRGGSIFWQGPPTPKLERATFTPPVTRWYTQAHFYPFPPVSICIALLCIDTINSPISPLFCQIPFSYFCPSNNICRYSPPWVGGGPIFNLHRHTCDLVDKIGYKPRHPICSPGAQWWQKGPLVCWPQLMQTASSLGPTDDKAAKSKRWFHHFQDKKQTWSPLIFLRFTIQFLVKFYFK